MGVATGCGCKEVYRFPHTTYPYSSCICSFLQQHPYFLLIFKNIYYFDCTIFIECMYGSGSSAPVPVPVCILLDDV